MVNVRIHQLIVEDERHHAAECLMQLADGLRGAQRQAEVEGLCGIEQLDGEHALSVEDDALQLDGGICSHRYQVFLVLTGRDTVYRGGHGQTLVQRHT